MITIQPLLVQHPDLVNRIRRSEWWHKPHGLKHLGYQNKKGSMDGTVSRALVSHQCDLSSNPEPHTKLTLLLVLALLQRFFFRFSHFSPAINSNLIWQWRKGLCVGCATENSYLQIYFYIYLRLSRITLTITLQDDISGAVNVLRC